MVGEDGREAVVDSGVAAGGEEGLEEDEDRLDRDTKLSRASSPRIAGPRLRSS